MSRFYPATVDGVECKQSVTSALKAVAAGHRVVFLLANPHLTNTIRVTNHNRDALIKGYKVDRGRVYLIPWPEGQKPNRAERKALAANRPIGPNTHPSGPAKRRIEATGTPATWEQLPKWVKGDYRDQMGTLPGYGPVAP